MFLKKVISLFFVVTLSATSLFAIQEDKIADVMKFKIDKVLTILQDKELKRDTQVENIFKLMNEVFDYQIMAKISLGKHWKKLTTEQKTEFSLLFEKKLKSSYIEKLDLYTDEKISIKGVDKVKSTRIKLLTQLVGKEETYNINYKFYRSKDANWFIYDVDIIGVSIITTYRKQFAGFLKDKSFDELLTNLK